MQSRQQVLCAHARGAASASALLSPFRLQTFSHNSSPTIAGHDRISVPPRDCDRLRYSFAGSTFDKRNGKRMKRVIAVVLAVTVVADAQRPAPNRRNRRNLQIPEIKQAGTNATTSPTEFAGRPTYMPSPSPMTPFPTEGTPAPVSRIELAESVPRLRDWRHTTNRTYFYHLGRSLHRP